MVELIKDLPDNVAGFSAKGKVRHEDYASVIVPAVEARLARHQKIRLLYHLGPEFSGLEAEAIWDDTKVGLGHPLAWERIALVTDVDWLRSVATLLGVVIPGKVRVFKNAALAEARQWVSEST